MAERLNVARQTVSKWERGLSTPDLDSLVMLNCLFGLTLDELARGEQPGERMLDLERLARESRRQQRRTVAVILGGVCVLLGVLTLTFAKLLEAYLVELHYTLYRYMTVGEYVYQHEDFSLLLWVAAAAVTVGAVFLLSLLWRRKGR